MVVCKRRVMVRAHKIARTLDGNYRARMSAALRQAWAEEKAKTRKDGLEKAAQIRRELAAQIRRELSQGQKEKTKPAHP